MGHILADDKQDSEGPTLKGTYSIPLRGLVVTILSALMAGGGVGTVAAQWFGPQHTTPIIDDKTAAMIGKVFAETTNQSNDRLIRSIESMNEATRDLAKASREQNEWCKMVIGEFTKELRSIKEEIIYSRELQVKAAHTKG